MQPLFSVEEGVMGGIMMGIIMMPFMFAGWMLIGLVLYAWSRARYGVAYSDTMMKRELAGAESYQGR